MWLPRARPSATRPARAARRSRDHRSPAPAADHHDLSPAHVALLYPPGPEGVTAAQLARRISRDPAAVDGLLEELAELGYVEFDSKEDPADRRAWLTIPGYDLVKAAEDELLGAP